MKGKAMFTITREFILGGKAIFTVSSPNGQHYTYLIEAVNFDEDSDETPSRFFVKLLTGPDNTSDYTYLGQIDIQTGEVFATKASPWRDALTQARRLYRQRKVSESAAYAKEHFPLPVQVIRWALMRIVWPGRDVPEGYGIDGEGRCGRCGRPLTHPDGITPDGHRFGFGPKCWAKVQAAA